MTYVANFNESRLETIAYHTIYYDKNELYESGSWLEKPDPELKTIVELLSEKQSPRLLDLGCGVGRNSIALAQALKPNLPKIDCLDFLEAAVSKLLNYAKEYNVEDMILGKVADMDNLELETDAYDCVLAVSVLEHSKSYDTMIDTIKKIQKSTAMSGANRFTFSTNRTVTCLESGDSIHSPVETELDYDQLVNEISELYKDWKVDVLDSVEYDENILRKGREVNWRCRDLSFFARKA